MKKADFFHSRPTYFMSVFAFILGGLFFSIAANAQCSVESFDVGFTSCPNNADGSITLVMIDVLPPVSYTWAGPTPGTLMGQGDSVVLSDLAAGEYSITINDDGTCATEITIEVETAADIQIELDIVDVICPNNNTGVVSYTITGGAPDYTVTLSNVGTVTGGSTGSFDDLRAGRYRITVVDSNNCEVAENFEIDEPPAITLLRTVTNTTCGLCNGTVTLTAFGGTPPYTYQLQGVTSASPVFTDLCVGYYVPLVFDANGCANETDLFVEEDGGIFSINAESSWQGCGTDCAGAIDVEITCGTPPFEITWSDPSLNGQLNVTDLCPGTFEVTVTDAEMNIASQTVAFGIPNSLELMTTTTDVTCNGNCDGLVGVVATGGEMPYTYLWSNGATEPSPPNLCAGTYTVTVSDALGCNVSATVTVLEPALLEVQLIVEDVNCQSGGSIEAMALGGTPPYVYQWNNGLNGNLITDLPAGMYILQVIDANGCVIELTAEVSSPIDLELSSTFANCDSTGGTATVTILGNVANPTYAWSTGGTMATETNLAPGGYSVTVTDTDNDCRVHQNVIVPLDTACFTRISGFVYLDAVNPDCMPDTGSEGLGGILVELDNGDFTFTDQNGFYEFEPLPGNFTLNIVLNTPQYDGLCIDPITVNAADFGGNYPDNNFYLERSVDRNMVLWANKGRARPGFNQGVNIFAMNRGGAVQSGSVTFVHSPDQVYLSSSPSATNYDAATRTLTWDFSDQPIGETFIYNVQFQIPVNTSLGTSLEMYFRVDPIDNDIEPDNNEINCTVVVTGAFDPNDKQVSPTGTGEEGNIGRQDSVLSYLIRFQNTGTDTAFTVVLLDTLDQNLDVSTVVPGPSSHDYTLDILKGNILEFTFDNILLPDSFVNEPASNGFVFFDVKVKPGLEFGTMIKNTAAIYFDFNAPIITNTVTNTLKMPTGVFSPEPGTINLSVLPNPSAGQGQLWYDLEQSERVRIRLFDAQGRLLSTLQPYTDQPAGRHQLPLDRSGDEPGLYFIHLETAKGQYGVLRWIQLE
ncbi:MAG: T9SS type A sorting domain-containing protein [Bacteroidota bacterium]